MEDDDAKTLLKKTFALAKENNRMLRKMRRAALIGNILRIIWWAVILGLPIVLYYYFLQPFVDQFFATYQDLQGGVENIQNVGDKLPELPSWLKTLLGFGGGE